MEKFYKIMQKILNFVLEIVAGALVLDVLLGVVTRYIFGKQVPWTEELSVVLLIWLSFLGIAAAFAARAHLGLDILMNYMDVSVKKKVVCIGHIITLAFVIIVFLVGGLREVNNSLTYINILPALHVSDVIRVIPLPISGIFIILFEIYNMKTDLTRKEEDHE